MKYLHYDIKANAGATVIVNLSAQANVRLMDDINFSRFRQGSRHEYYGGLAKVSPARLQVPHSGSWHVVVDLGGYAGRVSASVSVIQ